MDAADGGHRAGLMPATPGSSHDRKSFAVYAITDYGLYVEFSKWLWLTSK